MVNVTLLVAMLFFLGVVFLLGSLTYYLYTYNLLHSCRQYANIWCWTDWQCPNESDPAKQYPAESFYGCDSDRPRNLDYCKDAPPGTPGCTCSFASSPDGELPPGCTCEWDSSEYGSCGQRMCSGDSVVNCDKE